MMTLLSFFQWLNNDLFAVPFTLLFLGGALLLTVKLKGIQFRAFPLFSRLLSKGFSSGKKSVEHKSHTIDSFHALFTAMSTTIGMGNVVGPTVAIMAGGPGALFWLVIYMFLGSVLKFTEVTFALDTRVKTSDGYIIGGPMEYLRGISRWLANWYGIVMMFLFAGWSGVQANTLAQIFSLEGIPEWYTGLALATIVFIALSGGAARVGSIASKLVPIMFFFYVSFALLMLFKDVTALKNAILLVFRSVVSPHAAVGGFLGISVFQAMRFGIYRGVYISESGLGTAAIPHSVADTDVPVHQGVLALYSTIADIMLSILSGLLVLVTGIWMSGSFRSTLIYEVFKLHAPVLGQFVLVVSIALFVLTTVIGNSFNGTQSFASFTQHRWIGVYVGFTLITIFLGAMAEVKLAWEVMDTMITLVGVPNLIGIIILAFKRPDVLKLKKVS